MSVPAGLDPQLYRQAVADLLGVLGYAELTAFERLAADAQLAPTLADKAALGRMAVAEFGHYSRLHDRLAALGYDPEAAMTPFVAPLDAFHASTAAADWLEGLVKAYVGDGMAMDFYREVAALVDEQTRSLVLDVLADTGHAAFAVEKVRAAIEADPPTGGRLALWARRLVGEALTQAQRVAAERPALALLIVGEAGDGAGGAGAGGGAGGGGGAAALAALFTRLTDRHAERMQALGLSA